MLSDSDGGHHRTDAGSRDCTAIWKVRSMTNSSPDEIGLETAERLTAMVGWTAASFAVTGIESFSVTDPCAAPASAS